MDEDIALMTACDDFYTFAIVRSDGARFPAAVAERYRFGKEILPGMYHSPSILSCLTWSGYRLPSICEVTPSECFMPLAIMIALMRKSVLGSSSAPGRTTSARQAI